jgi:hypothetical protein
MAYATWNPADKGASVTLSGGDLVATCASGVNHNARSTVSKSAGKWYWEVSLQNTGGMGIMLGVANASQSVTASPLSGSDCLVLRLNDGSIWKGGSSVGSMGTTLDNGDVLSIAYDAGAGTVGFSKNGGAYTTISGGDLPSGALFALFCGGGGSGADEIATANFGASAFIYTPPTGHVGLSDTLDFSHTMTGGFLIGGEAEIYPPAAHVMTGGFLIGGAAAVEFVLPFRHTMTGGFKIGGTATIEFVESLTGTISASAPAATGELVGEQHAFGTIEAEAGIPASEFTAGFGASGTISATVRGRVTGVLAGGMQYLAATAPAASAALTAILGKTGTIVARTGRVSAELMAVQTLLATITAETRAPTSSIDATAGSVAQIVAATPRATASLQAVITVTATLEAEAPAPRSAFVGSQGGYGSIVTTVGRARAQFTVHYVPDSELVDVVVVNTINAGVTEYESYEYDSFCTIGSTVYAAGADGIYEIDSAGTDEGAAIDAYFESGDLDFGSEYLKRMEALYLAYRTNGDIRVTVRTDEGTAYVYPMKYDQVSTIKRRRVPTGKGLRGSYWRVKVANVAGSSLDVDNMNVLAHETVRRIGA